MDLSVRRFSAGTSSDAQIRPAGHGPEQSGTGPMIRRPDPKPESPAEELARLRREREDLQTAINDRGDGTRTFMAVPRSERELELEAQLGTRGHGSRPSLPSPEGEPGKRRFPSDIAPGKVPLDERPTDPGKQPIEGAGAITTEPGIGQVAAELMPT